MSQKLIEPVPFCLLQLSICHPPSPRLSFLRVCLLRHVNSRNSFPRHPTSKPPRPQILHPLVLHLANPQLPPPLPRRQAEAGICPSPPLFWISRRARTKYRL